MAGNPRSILLPVTIKDMKDLKSIKIINAADLKNASNIKLAAANLLSQSKSHSYRDDRNDYEYDHGGNCGKFPFYQYFKIMPDLLGFFCWSMIFCSCLFRNLWNWKVLVWLVVG